MKIKIRGLVFVGFAAAVFASSARAAVPNDQVPGVTVTSRAYTEKTYEHKAPALEVDGNGVVTDEAAWIGWHSGQNNENAEWVKLEGEKQLSSTSTDGTSPNTEYVKIIHQNKNGQQKHYVTMETTSIAGTADSITAAGETSGAGDTITDLEKKRLTTAKAVYDYVNGNDGGDGFHRKITESEARNLATLSSNGTAGYGVEIGYRAYDSTAAEGQQYGGSEWSVLTAKENNADINNSENNHLAYLNIGKTGSDARPAFEIDIKPAALAEDAQAIRTGGTATGDTAHLTRDRLTTAKAVYDFVTNYADGAYQPKIADADHSKVMIGVNTRTGTEGSYTYNSSWQELGDGTYIESSTSNGATTIDIKSGQVAGTIENANSVKLATEGAVYGYAVQKDWGSANANKTLVTNGSGIVTVSDTPAIPGTDTMPSECYGANATAHCALVSKWVAAQGTEGQQDYVAAHLELTWTVMADQTD